VDGADFFDMLAEDIVVDYVITLPGYPRHVVGCDAVAEFYRPYGTQLTLDRCFDLAVYDDRERGVIVLEYASECSAVATGATSANRYISVPAIEGRKVTRWRDYLDPLAVFDALDCLTRPVSRLARDRERYRCPR
jgi:ketosteroid isomerase-like protein